MRIIKRIPRTAICSVLLFSMTARACAEDTVTAAQSLEKITDEYMGKVLSDYHDGMKF